MLEDLIAFFTWVGDKFIEIKIHGFKKTLISYIVTALIILIVLGIYLIFGS